MKHNLKGKTTNKAGESCQESTLRLSLGKERSIEAFINYSPSPFLSGGAESLFGNKKKHEVLLAGDKKCLSGSGFLINCIALS